MGSVPARVAAQPNTLSWGTGGNHQLRSENSKRSPRTEAKLSHALLWPGPIVLSRHFPSLTWPSPARVPPKRALLSVTSGLLPISSPPLGMPSGSPPHSPPVPNANQPSMPEALSTRSSLIRPSS